MKKRPSYVKAIIAATIMALFLSGALISVQLTKAKEMAEENYKSIHARISAEIFNKGFGYYISEDNDREGLAIHLSNFTEGVNFSVINVPYTDQLAVTDIYRYYDPEKNSIMKKDILVMAEREDPDSKKYTYHTFHDDAASEKLDKLVKEHREEIGMYILRVNDVYVKDDTFIPGKFSYYTIGEGGSKKNETVLYICDKTREEMEAEGYTFEHKNESFFLGEPAMGDRCFAYIYGVDSDREPRIEEIFKEAEESTGGELDHFYVKKDLSPVSMEFYSFRKNEVEEAENVYYVLAYERMNVLFSMYNTTFRNGRGILYIELFGYEACGIIFLFIIVAAVTVKIIRVKRKD